MGFELGLAAWRSSCVFLLELSELLEKLVTKFLNKTNSLTCQ